MQVDWPERRAAVQRPPKPRTPWTVWAGIAGFVAMTSWAAFRPLGGMGFTIAPLFNPDRLEQGRRILAEFLRPNWSFLERVWQPFVETFLIAVIAAVIGVALSLPFAIMASRVSGVGRIMYAFVKLTNSVIRSLPDIAWGLLAVAAVGTGALAGILALIFFNLGIMVKLTAETVDAVDLGPIEAAEASGATRVQAAWQSIVPQVLPNYLSYGLYVFELNLRASVVIGFVGGGGIGNVIAVQFTGFRYANLSAVIIVLFVVVFVLDRVSIAVRRRLV